MVTSAKAGNRSNKHCQVAILKVQLIERHVVESNQTCLKNKAHVIETSLKLKAHWMCCTIKAVVSVLSVC